MDPSPLNTTHKRRGFTLVEVVVVIAILGIIPPVTKVPGTGVTS